MPEVANCPCCGRVLEELFNINYNPDYYECPDVLCAFVCSAKDLPRIAAAMEFSIAESWEEETDKVREWLDVSTDNVDAYNEIVDININAERAVFAARESSNEVFK